MRQKLITVEEIIENCERYGFKITKPGFAQYLADECNKPIEFPKTEIKLKTELDIVPYGYLGYRFYGL